MAKLDPRKLMEQAIEVMRQSVSEPRADGKASPLVGAVLWKPDGTVETACRGELRYGDHAEYALLERKNRHCKLDGALLFATLSPLENAFATAETKDFSTEALEQYRAIAKIGDKVGSPAFNRRLVQQGLLRQEKGLSTPTGFGFLLFGREPRTVMPQAGLLGTIHFADGTEEPKDFDGPQVLAPEQALQWLRDKLPDPIERSAARRRQANESLFELVREGVVNALVHRDYAIEGAKCQLVVTPDTITVKSPGKPVEPITLEQMQSFDAPMLSRNPVLHYVFARNGRLSAS